MFRLLVDKALKAWSGLWSDSVECPTCKGRAEFAQMWGRHSVYECGRCGGTTKVKCYD